MTTIDSYLPDEKVRKKLNIRFHSPKFVKNLSHHPSHHTQNLYDYDPRERNHKLKKIAELQTSINSNYRQDLIKNMQEKKEEEERRHKMQVHRILQKYRLQQEANNSKLVQGKSTTGLRQKNYHKIDSYAQVNKLKKQGQQENTVKSLDLSHQRHSRLQSQPKLKPYLIYGN